jgi:erythronate-4-phosphate dehydrogenase
LLTDLTLGIVGVGHVGSAVERKARALGMKVLLNDPPRQIREGNPNLLPLARVLHEADVISLHVPLTRLGPFATAHLADHRFFEKVCPGSLFINTSRGEVVDSDALLMAMDRGVVLAAALDVWEQEPSIREDVMERVDISTPHIAGYSYEGKLNGTLMLYDAACGFFELEPSLAPARYLSPPPRDPVELDGRGKLEEDLLSQAVRAAYDIEEDDRLLRAMMGREASQRGDYFRDLRRNYYERREFPCTRILGSHMDHDLRRKLSGLGFIVESGA